MQMQFDVTVTVHRESGKFASKDEIATLVQEALENADFDLTAVGADGDSVYEVDEVEVTLR